jgi:[protein-PII] uridylyltransferase
VEAGPIFLELLECRPEVPVRRGSMLGELHEVGLLLAMIPEFTPLTGRVQHDVYHVYTVDVHSIAAVDRLRAVRRGECTAELSLATRLSADLTQPELLHLGVLLHDVGKGRGGDHSEKGAVLAGPICQRLGLGPADAAHVVWLVRAHLRLYHWAMRRDTSDEETARAMAQEIGTQERLRDLYLLTVVDLSTTNPTALSSWKAHMLDAAHDDAAHALRSHGERESVPPRAESMRGALEQAVASVEGGRRFLDGMPERYVLTTDSARAQEHARLWAEIEQSGRLPRAVLHRQDETGPRAGLAELVVVATDRPGLLADIAAVLASQRLAIVTASIHTREREKLAFDVFEVRKAALDAGPPEAEVAGRIEKDLSDLHAGAVTVPQLLRRRGKVPAWAQRKSPAVRTEILVHGDASSDHTVIDVFTRDRVGLLHAIARALYDAGLSIALSKVSTEGERVADVFYVVDRKTGQKLTRERAAEVERGLRAAIEALDADEQPRAS